MGVGVGNEGLPGRRRIAIREREERWRVEMSVAGGAGKGLSVVGDGVRGRWQYGPGEGRTMDR